MAPQNSRRTRYLPFIRSIGRSALQNGFLRCYVELIDETVGSRSCCSVALRRALLDAVLHCSMLCLQLAQEPSLDLGRLRVSECKVL